MLRLYSIYFMPFTAQARATSGIESSAAKGKLDLILSLSWARRSSLSDMA